MNRNILTPELLKKFRKALDEATIGSATELQLLLTFRVVDELVAATEELIRREEFGESVADINAELQSKLAAMTANRDGMRQHRDELEREIKRLNDEMLATAKMTGEYIACCEGGGPENIAGSLALSVGRLKSLYKTVQEVSAARGKELLIFEREQDKYHEALEYLKGRCLCVFKDGKQVEECAFHEGLRTDCLKKGNPGSAALEERVRSLEGELEAALAEAKRWESRWCQEEERANLNAKMWYDRQQELNELRREVFKWYPWDQRTCPACGQNWVARDVTSDLTCVACRLKKQFADQTKS